MSDRENNILKYVPASSRSNMSIKLSSSLVSPNLAEERNREKGNFTEKTEMEHFF